MAFEVAAVDVLYPGTFAEKQPELKPPWHSRATRLRLQCQRRETDTDAAVEPRKIPLSLLQSASLADSVAVIIKKGHEDAWRTVCIRHLTT